MMHALPLGGLPQRTDPKAIPPEPRDAARGLSLPEPVPIILPAPVKPQHACSSVLSALAGLCLCLCLPAQEPPSQPALLLPDSPLKTRMAQLAPKRPAPAPGTAPRSVAKADLLRPELNFQPRRRWLLLPELARQLGTDDEQRNALRELLQDGAAGTREALAAEGADKDVGAAAALFVVELWQFARNIELPEEHTNALHAQIVAILAVPEVAKMNDADKQRFWEFTVGIPIFFRGMAEVVQEDAPRARLREAASRMFEALLGVSPADVEIGANGLTLRAARPPAARPVAKDKSVPVPVPAPVGRGQHGSASLPHTGPAIPGVTYTPPAGWSREEANGNTLFRTTLVDVDRQGRPETNNAGSHQATIGVLPVLSARHGPTALFDQTWRDQFGGFELGDTFVHYRARLPSQLVVLYMGRFFARPNAPQVEGNPKTYGALYLVDLGGDRLQPLVAVVEPRSTSIGMDTFKEGAALQALSFPLWSFLESVRPARGAPPYPAGGFFAAEDLRGRWTTSGGAFGGTYYNTVTGGFAGAAVLSSGGRFFLGDDGVYEYAFSYASSHPQFGKSGGSTNHGGRYRLNGDIVLVEPSKPIPYNFTCCAVGIGVRQTAQGPRRVLTTVTAQADGGFRAPPLVPNWDQYEGTMTWYTEDPAQGAGTAPPTGVEQPPVPAGPPNTLRQWASAARASSEYRETGYSAAQATGAPNVARAADDPRAWAPKLPDAGEEWLEVTFAQAVRATEARVVQSFQPGAIVRIDTIDESGTATTVWTGPDQTVYEPGRIGVLSATFNAPAKPVVRLKIVLDTRRVASWNEIDAVELIGSRH